MVSVGRYNRCLRGCDLPAGYKSRHITLSEDKKVFDWNSKISSSSLQPLLMSREMEAQSKAFYELFQSERDALKDPKHKKPRKEFFKVTIKPEKSTFKTSRIYSAAPKEYCSNKYTVYPLTFGRTTGVISHLQGRCNRSLDLRYSR